jgi:hypothetical protein
MHLLPGVTMKGMMGFGKLLVGIGLAIAAIGAVLLIAGRLGLPLGRLPGDVAYRGKHVSVFFPLGTSILISVVLSLLLYLLSRFRR